VFLGVWGRRGGGVKCKRNIVLRLKTLEPDVDLLGITWNITETNSDQIEIRDFTRVYRWTVSRELSLQESVGELGAVV